MITATDRAVERLKDGLVQRCISVGLGYRVIKDSETTGAKFTIKLDTAKPEDEVVMAYGIRIIIGPFEAALLKDVELDYSDKPGGGFCLKNNSATSEGE